MRQPAASALDLAGRTAVVTGGGGLLGRSFAHWLSAAGAVVVVADIDLREAEGTARFLLEQELGTCAAMHVDVTDQRSVAELVQRTLATYGALDVFVNSAALDPKVSMKGDTVLASGEDDWRSAVDVNLTGPYLCCEEVIPQMRRENRGSIINVSSIYGLVGPDQRLYDPTGGQAVTKPAFYSATKAGLSGLTRFYAASLAGTKVRVNTLTLGGIEAQQPPDFKARYSSRTILGRMGSVDDAGAALLFLASNASSYMTGADVVVDGGWTAW